MSSNINNIGNATATIEEAIKIYGLKKIAISFNGGKDSLVLLHIFYEIVGNLKNIPVLFKNSGDDFKDNLKYVKKIKDVYNLNLIEFIDFKESIKFLKDNYNTEAIMIGSRKDDPHGNKLSNFIKTDPGWPDVMRVYPILDMTYGDVWNYILDNTLEYNKMYDQGYTSIGDRFNTFRNFTLFDTVKNRYLPAYKLVDYSKERAGRIKGQLPLIFEGIVVSGFKRGTSLGIPTINILTDQPVNIDEGVYYGKVVINDVIKNFAASIGHNIHFNNTQKTIELHILEEISEVLYEKHVKVRVLGFIRKMEKYDDDLELIKAIKRDIQIAKYELSLF